MSEEGFEEWDADFLDQLIQVEEIALSATASNPRPNPSQHHLHQPPSFSYLPQPPPPPRSHDNAGNISHSPPRELTQRTPSHVSFDRLTNGISNFPSTSLLSCGSSVQDLEIKRLKGELDRVSKQLSGLEQECFELRKEKDKKEDQSRFLYSRNQENDDNEHLSRRLQKTKSYDAQLGSRINIATSTSKAVGVQTEKADDCADSTLNDDVPASHELSKKLLAIWGSPDDKNLGRNLISKLFAACPTDFHVLFGCLGTNVSSKVTLNSLPRGCHSGVVSTHDNCSVNTSEATKVSHLYFVLTKISNGMACMEALLEPLLDLCRLESVVVAHRSLRVLHVILKHLLSLERKPGGRDNVLIEELCSRNSSVDLNGPGGATYRGLFPVNRDKTSSGGYIPCGLGFPDADVLGSSCYNHGTALSVSRTDWVSLFEVMRQIAMKNIGECVRVEAVSIMNMIVMRSSAYMEREKFGQTMVFESVSLLLKKEAGTLVRNEAMQLMFLLLNCPKILAIFCNSCKQKWDTDSANDNAESVSDQGFGILLEGLADCVANSGIGAEDLKLRRNTIIVLSFLASSGKSGFEILLGQKLSRGANFLMLILQVLVSEMDAEAAATCLVPPEISKERTLLIREALILLNRLVSSPAYSAIVMRELTSSRDMASLTIDIASRLSWKEQRLGQPDGMTRQIRESEVVDLARVFKKRVLSYLGDNVS